MHNSTVFNLYSLGTEAGELGGYINILRGANTCGIADWAMGVRMQCANCK